MKNWIKISLELGKVRISGLVTLSTATGFILASGHINGQTLIVMLGIFILAMGSAAMNQFQERHMDARMQRTRTRPIPSGRVSASQALFLAFLFMIIGSGILWLAFGWLVAGLGILTAIWYNGIYTPLKRVTPFAVVPGAVIGALPPAVGWTAGGGNLMEPQLWALLFFFFIWQIPHFWLLLLHFGKDYEEAGFPSLTAKFSPPQLARITYMWILATSLVCISIPLFGLGSSPLLFIALVGLVIWLNWSSRLLLQRSLSARSFSLAFRGINIFLLLVMVIFTLDRLLMTG